MLALALLMHNDTHFIVSFSFSMIRYDESFNHELITKQLSSICSFHMQQKIICTNIFICILAVSEGEIPEQFHANANNYKGFPVSFIGKGYMTIVCAWGRGGGGHSLLTVQNLKIRTKSTQNIASMFLFFNIKTYNSLTKNRKIREFIKRVNSVPRAVNT